MNEDNQTAPTEENGGRTVAPSAPPQDAPFVAPFAELTPDLILNALDAAGLST